MDEALAAELAAMAEEDQRIRQAPADAVLEWRPSPEQSMGPGRSLVGEEGADHAWLVAQHADHQFDLQRRALELLREAVAAAEATPKQVAYLTDRVRMNEGRPQVYGTQIADMDEHGGVPWPVEDRDHLDERRAEVGLEPFAEYARGFVASGDGTTVAE